MPEYIYKGFKIYYEITTIPHGHNAKGFVINYTEKDSPYLTEKFQTESPTYSDAEKEIRKLIEQYIDFEYRQFLEMREND